ncbi:hypothetical protein [Streptomyces sp. NPDC058657]|uniref:hypothetical protein n=1 Tax=unclassified Streptomyces TaxID=2593676 RepID=UPI003667D286
MKEVPRIGGVSQRRPELSDAVARVAHGDQETFATLYGSIAGPVYGLALEVLRDPARPLAHYQGHTCQEVAASLPAPLGTVHTRLRDGLIRPRDCVGVNA